MIESVFGGGAESLEAAQFCKRWLALIEVSGSTTSYVMRFMQSDQNLPEVWRNFAKRTVGYYTGEFSHGKSASDLYKKMLADLEENQLLPYFAISMFRISGEERDALRTLLGVYGFERTLGGHNALSL